MKIDKKAFTEWACSLAGCDGGNPNAQIWVCGIEWGCSEKDAENYYKNTLPDEIAKGKFEPPGKYEWQKTIGYPFGRSIAKLYCAIKGERVESYGSFVRTLSDIELFKLNLYPIAFNSTSNDLWNKYALNELTGISEKHLFKTWCFLNRFPMMVKLVKEKKPTLIIGTGINYIVDFFACFVGYEPGIEIHSGTISDSSTSRNYYWARYNGGETLLIVVPFPSGRYGLNSDALIQEMGIKINNLITRPL